MSQAVLSDAYVGYSEELGIFEKPLQNVGIRRTHKTTFYPVNDFTNQGVIQFTVMNNGSNYLDLRSTRLNITCKIVGSNGETVSPPEFPDIDDDESADETDEEKKDGPAGSGGGRSKRNAKTSANKIIAAIAPVNNFMHSMFQRVDVSLQNKVLTHSDQAYAYLSYLKALLYTSDEVKKGALQMAMYYKDEGGVLANANWLITDNEGLKARGEYFKNSKEVDMCGHLYSDVLEISRYIPNGVPLGLTLYPSSPEFCLMSPNNDVGKFKVVITKASLDVTMIEVDPLISVAHAELLQTRPAIFPYIKTEVKRFTMSKGVFSGEFNDPFNGRIPSEMVCGLVSDSSNHGTLVENPFLFEHNSLNFIQVTVDGQDLSQAPIQPKYVLGATDTNNSLFMDAYKTLSGVDIDDQVIPISRDEYGGGYCLYRFFSEPQTTAQNIDVTPLKRTGNMRITLKFDEQLNEPTTLIIFAKFGATLHIDKNRAVFEV